jgi:hypothetical protein
VFGPLRDSDDGDPVVDAAGSRRAAAGPGAGRVAVCGAGGADPTVRRRRLLRRTGRPGRVVRRCCRYRRPQGRAAVAAVRRCGRQRKTGSMRSTWMAPRSPWPRAARAGHGHPGADPSGPPRRHRRAGERRRPRPAPPHPAPRATGPADRRTRRARRRVRLFIHVTNRDVSTLGKAVVVEHWYRHRTQVETSRRQPRRRAASSSLGVSPGQSGVEVRVRCSR